MRSICDLPPELITLIFTLASDKPTLSACTLVSRLWQDLATPLVFASVTVRVEGQYELAGFTQFIAEHPHHSAAIKTLTVVHDPELRVSSYMCCNALLPVLEKLCALVQLSLQKGIQFSTGAADCGFSDTKRHKIGKLLLDFPAVYASEQLIALNHFLSHLSIEHLDTIHLPIGDPEVTLFSRVVDVRHLWMRRPIYSLECHIRFFRYVLLSDTLHSLSMMCPGPSSIQQSASLVRDAGRNIRSLSIGFSWIQIFEPNQLVVDCLPREWLGMREVLAACHRMETLDVFQVPRRVTRHTWQCQEQQGFTPSFNDTIPLFESLLVSLPHTVRELTIGVRSCYGVVEFWDLKAIDSLLTRESLSYSTSVTMNLPPLDIKERRLLEELVVNALPRLNASGLLRITFDSRLRGQLTTFCSKYTSV
ncbi:hypothetical protein C8Q76DRAFT_726182 [Earliella scabrosa]|nr:hypothetical protein C8Q76DRAFT_726182 [Earliella scabrosa]